MTDSRPYKCCEPPVWLQITSQERRSVPGGGSGSRIKAAKQQAAIDYLLAGHTTDEVGKRFHRRPTTIADAAREAGYTFNVHTRRWGAE